MCQSVASTSLRLSLVWLKLKLRSRLVEVEAEAEVEAESRSCCTRILYPYLTVCMCKCIIQLFFVCLNRVVYYAVIYCGTKYQLFSQPTILSNQPVKVSIHSNN